MPAKILDTDITITSTDGSPIKGKYTAVDVIADGRCFFGSLDLAKRISDGDKYSNELINDITSNLNEWIQANLIETVIKFPFECTIIQAVATYARSSELAKIDDENTGDRKVITEEQSKSQNTLQLIDETIPAKITVKCPFQGDVSDADIQTLLENPNYIGYQNQFITFCRSFIEKKNNEYTYAEPEVITQILSNKLQKNIGLVNNNYSIIKMFYSNDDPENTLPTIYVNKLAYAHYHALIPTENIPIAFSESTPNSLKIKYKGCEIKDLPSTGFRGSYGSSRTDRIIGKKTSDTENVVSKVNKIIRERPEFSRFQPITENDVTLKNDKEPSTTNDNLRRARTDDYYFLVNLKEKSQAQRGGKYKKRTRKKKHIQHRKSQKRRSKSRKKH
jgi:hypothetical protein